MTGLQQTTSSVDLLDTDGSGQSAEQSDSEEVTVTVSSSGGSGKDTFDRTTEEEGDPSSSVSSQVSGGVMQVESQAEGEERDDVVMMEIQPDSEGESSGTEVDIDVALEDHMNGDIEAGPSQEGKRVKVYELRDSSWFDRGTGFCKGIYDDTQDLALIIVEPEDMGEGGKVEAPGGFLKDELLLSARVEKEDIYGKQQDTLIVWTEPSSGLDIALSFQDADGCDDIWQFICEVQRHLLNMSGAHQTADIISCIAKTPANYVLNLYALNNGREQEMFIRMQSKSPLGRERAVEHILNEDYIKHLITVLEQAEDLESLEDLHALCSLMQTILLFNDNGIFEYILQDDVFLGVIGMLEYDPEFPGLKASYRQFFQETARFRQVVEIKDDNIRNKIHQTYRLLYLKDVVLARVLDDPTFNILNGFVFFNQVDIINHIQQNEAFLSQLFEGFREQPTTVDADPLDERKRDVVMFLHQLMIMGKGVQLPSRLALYRNLIDRGVLFVCEWAFKRTEAQLLHAGAEILTLAVEHDANAVRVHVFREDEAKRKTLVMEIIELLHSTKNLGLMSQMSDTLRTLLESAPENEVSNLPPTLRSRHSKEGPLSDTFGTYFYENCASILFKPLLDAPDIKADIAKGKPAKLPREHGALLQSLVELLSFCIINHAHRASYFILSNPISKKVVGLLYVRDKPLRHAALRFVRACLKTPNHFIHRYYVKNDLLLPLLDLLNEESNRDNMMSSACMEVLELIRKENLKNIINYMFDDHRREIEQLADRPYLRAIVNGLRSRFEINSEPPPPPPAISQEAESSKSWGTRAAAEEEEYFNASDDEEVIGPQPPGTASTTTSTGSGPLAPQKRKRMFTHGGGPKKRPAGARQPGSTAVSPNTGANTSGTTGGGALGLDYDDGSDSDSSSGGQSPRIRPDHISPDSGSSSSSQVEPKEEAEDEIKVTEELEEDLGDVAMRMRAKRAREEEEEEGFAGLLVGAKSTSATTASTTTEAADSGEALTTTPRTAGGDEGKKGVGATAGKDKDKDKDKDKGKKIRLNFSLGKKLGGGGSGGGGGGSGGASK
ncbi:hypothetical protein I316_05199 [Kwoniella heveanensis BCC8398]|uniref:Uncharacterized protein n=1 Tax=Kwoniella heveanensis BCC8398 TaxID=1296120 RepID=A0A1B9GPY0_9TREE|nr:hypothetical protein I316_05199 [Kwoniella heveanensis BCC8398]